ncbi:MAG: hypothetical protein ACI9UR_002190 [Bacteroidia bacterium]|jgi:hypothetical protein
MKAPFSLFLFLFSIAFSSLAQQKVEYTVDFVFKEGIYLSVEDFKNNNPVPLTHTLSDFDIRKPDYLDLVLDSDSLTYFDNLFEERTIAVLNIWGYCKAGKVHLGYNTVPESYRWDNRGWFPILSIGAYSYFTAVIIMTRFIPPAPGAMMQSRGTILDDGSMFNDQGSYYDETVPIQCLLDWSDGQIVQLATGDLTSVSSKLIDELLTADTVLQMEFQRLARREQKQSAMFYIRKYNMRNPISFPE